MLTYSLVQQHRWHQSKGPYRSDIYGTSLLWRTSEGFKAWKLGQLDSQYHGLKLKRKSWVEIQYLIDTQSFLQTIEWKLGIPSQETRSKATDQLLGTMARKLCRYSNLNVSIDSQNRRRCWPGFDEYPLPDPNFFFATQTRPELFFIISEFRVFLSKLFPSRPLQIF